jgi:hypothetical protein
VRYRIMVPMFVSRRAKPYPDFPIPRHSELTTCANGRETALPVTLVVAFSPRNVVRTRRVVYIV